MDLKNKIVTGLLISALSGCVGNSESNITASYRLPKNELLSGKRVRVVYVTSERPFIFSNEYIFSWPRPIDFELIENTSRELLRQGAYVSPAPVSLDDIDFAINSIQNSPNGEDWDYLMITHPAGFGFIRDENLSNALVPIYNGNRIRFENLGNSKQSNISSIVNIKKIKIKNSGKGLSVF